MLTEEEIKAEEEAKAKEEADAAAEAAKEEARIAEEEAAKEEERRAAEEAGKKEFKPDRDAALHEAREQNRQLREQNQQMMAQMDAIQRRLNTPIDTKEFDETLGEGGTAKLKKMMREESLKSVTPFIKPLYKNSIDTRKGQLRAENPKLWAQVETEVDHKMGRIVASGFEPVPQDVDDAYDSAVGRLARAGKLSGKPRIEREIVGEVKHNSPGGIRPARKPVITSEIKKEAVRMGVSEEAAAEILENRKKLQTKK